MPRTPSRSSSSHRPPHRIGDLRWGWCAVACLALALLTWGCDGDPQAPETRPGPAAGPGAAASGPVLSGTTGGGHYRIRVRPAAPPLVLHEMHDWIVGIELVDDASEIPTAVTFDGGMPSHGHGFVTQPRVTRNLGGGEFLVEGVRFHMPGEWVVKVIVTSRSGGEQVTLPLTLDP